MGEWISCKNQMPPSLERVLVAVETSNRVLEPKDKTVYVMIATYCDGIICKDLDPDTILKIKCMVGRRAAYDATNDAWCIRKGWYCDGVMLSSGPSRMCSLTHWMPLPEPPNEGV